MSQFDDLTFVEASLLSEVCRMDEIYLGPGSVWLREGAPPLESKQLIVSEPTSSGGAWVKPTSAGREVEKQGFEE